MLSWFHQAVSQSSLDALFKKKNSLISVCALANGREKEEKWGDRERKEGEEKKFLQILLSGIISRQ